jgi:pimeloyl-ACP methyl ester carboxylesterase
MIVSDCKIPADALTRLARSRASSQFDVAQLLVPVRIRPISIHEGLCGRAPLGTGRATSIPVMPGFGSLEYEEFGEGQPLLALHPLALESSAFFGLGKQLASRGIRTLAVDLPGFGRTAAPDGPLTPARLAEPVLELARSLDPKPIILGMSMGGRVALEVALQDPEAVRGVVGVVTYLPWRRRRQLLRMAERIDPSWAERLPLERAWPLLKAVTNRLERLPRLEHDWFTRACVRVAYYSTCATTRTSLLSASRELALDPAFGVGGLWQRLENLAVPAAFVWAGRDGLIPSSHAQSLHEVLPWSHQIEAPCSAHFVNAKHYRCMEHAMTLGVTRVLEDSEHPRTRRRSRAPSLAPCLAERSLVASTPEYARKPAALAAALEARTHD